MLTIFLDLKFFYNFEKENRLDIIYYIDKKRRILSLVLLK